MRAVLPFVVLIATLAAAPHATNDFRPVNAFACGAYKNPLALILCVDALNQARMTCAVADDYLACMSDAADAWDRRVQNAIERGLRERGQGI